MDTKAPRARFEAEVIQGHGGVTVVLVPFDPEDVFCKKPITIDERRHGWLVKGKMNGAPFDGWIGDRWGRFFIILDAELRRAANVEVGSPVDVVVEPTASAKALAKAREQAKLTTAPRRRSPRARG